MVATTDRGGAARSHSFRSAVARTGKRRGLSWTPHRGLFPGVADSRVPTRRYVTRSSQASTAAQLAARGGGISSLERSRGSPGDEFGRLTTLEKHA